MLSQTLQDAIHEQIKHEIYSAYLYLSMSAYLESARLPGFAHWTRVQSQEEWDHAMKLFDYVHERNGHVRLQAIDQPPADFASAIDVAQKVLEHEQKVSRLIDGLYEAATREGDHATQTMLQWFITEQVEEEKTASVLVDQLKMVGTEGLGLFLVDRQLGEREAEE